MKKFITTTLALAMFTTLAIAQEKPAAKPAAATQAVSDPVIIAAGNLTVRKSEFESAIKTLPAEYQQFAMGPGKKQFAEDFLRMKLLAAEGARNGLDKSESVTAQLNLIRENLVANSQLEKLESGITVPDADIQKAYDANKTEYEQVKARHILISWKGSPVPSGEKKELTEAEAKAKADEIRAKIVAGGNFEELAKAESYDAGSGTRGGDLGAFGRGQMVPEFEQVAFAAKVGDISQPIKTQFGYHIIKVDSHDTTPLADVKEALVKEEKQKRLQSKIDEIKTKANATFNTSYFGEEAPAAPAAPAETKPVTK